jgi:ribosomal peptide maturation radical SAM protein 1
MPFALADRPSIQCGLLKAALDRAGYKSTVFYLNLELAAEFGALFYRDLSIMRVNMLLGDWLFSTAAFGHRSDEEEYRRVCGAQMDEACSKLGIDFERLCELRNEAFPAWISRWAREVDWGRYAAVGFTSSFEQNAASFALASAIKELHPEVVTIFGGPNFDGTMGREYVRVLPFIDYAVIGEGDHALLQILERTTRGGSALGIQGVVGRSGGKFGKLVDGGPASPIRNLDDISDPDYQDYFETLSRLGRERVLRNAPIILPFETSRGCWWGEKQHCTFCGLNDHTMQYRSKSPVQAIGQLERLASRYRVVNFAATDNILDYKYLEQLCAPLAEKRYDFHLFYEVKANLSPAQVRAMRRAGVDSIQPGIESLNSRILALMRKGITMLRNVRFLKWAHYYGMKVGWNILTGFPGESAEDYEQQLRVLPLLRHLPPPNGNTRISLERFSPFFFDPSFPVHKARPVDVYRFIYPEERLDLREIAYFFDHEMGSTLPDEFHQDLTNQVTQWKAAWQRSPRPTLIYQRAPEWIQIVDRRTEEVAVHAFQRREAAIYEICAETDQTVEGICKQLAETMEDDADPREVRASLAKFCDMGLMLEEKDRYLSLALPVNQHW